MRRDSLDFNLHSAILSSLAANLASSSTQDDLSLLTDSFSSREPVTNGLVNGVLSRLGLDEGASAQHEDPIVSVLVGQRGGGFHADAGSSGRLHSKRKV